LTRYRRELVGFIFQRFQIIEELTVADNVALPLLPLGVSLRERRQRTAEALERLNISHRSSFPAGGISGGELQRVAIARALINDPAIILADEPTAHLDSRLSLQFMDIIEELKAAGKAIVIASHDPLVFDHPVIDRCLFMRDGRLTAHRPD
jgi:putative ABC transport system ATP-binding protein